IVLLQKSEFDGQHQYVLLVKEGSSAKTIVFDPDTQNINQILLTGKYYIGNIEKDLEIPIDATINANLTKKPFSSFMFGLIFSKNSMLPIADRIKLWLFAKDLKEADISNSQLQLPVTADENKTIEKLFTDRTLYQEAKTITIVNSTDLNGLASRFAKLLTNIGANVIMVTSGNTQQKSSIQYVGATSYTLSRISRIIGVVPKVINSTTAISDITVIIGEDKVNTNKF
ncbi:MAG: LytR C-terminal domain-containing protein, partial [Patescibacteria group bacterium]|nr:LytR C-terminal domain-containing protein [Patescibacteria group bacterium]